MLPTFSETSSGVRLISLCFIIAIVTTTMTKASYVGESSPCLTLYAQGGAPPVFQSPKCPRWKHHDSLRRCQTAVRQGRRSHLEDRALCALDLRIPFPGEKLNTGNEIYTSNGVRRSHQLDIARFKHFLKGKYDDWLHFDILKEALLRATRDIDAKFSMEASWKNLVLGTTASIILLADGHIFVANIRDSKAFLCTEKFQSPVEAKAAYLRYRRERRNGVISSPLGNYKKNFELASSSSGLVHFSVRELTSDHHPDRDDEKFHVETSGVYLELGSVPRVNGQPAISRSIGDVPFKSFGVISTPDCKRYLSGCCI